MSRTNGELAETSHPKAGEVLQRPSVRERSTINATLDLVQILESISDAFVSIDREWRFRYLNAKAQQVFKTNASRLIGRYCWASFPEGLRTEGCRKLRQAMSDGEPVYYLEYSPRFKIWYEVTAYPYAGGLSIYFRDVTERVAAEQKLRLLDRAVAASVNALVITTARRGSYSIVHVNPAFERVTGYSASEVMGRNCRFLQGNDTNQPELETLRTLFVEQKEGRVSLRNYRKDGSMFFNELLVAPVRSSKGNVTHFVGVLNDITEIKKHQEELERHINHDALTGLANRHLLQDRLEQSIRHADRCQGLFAVMFLDLDHFKLVNDGLGHHVGDLLLKHVASELIKVLRPEDTIARFGGDEFVLIANDIAGAEEAGEIAERVTTRLTQHVSLESQDINISASIGIAMYPSDGTGVEDLLKNADAAMYHSKERGRNAFSFYRQEMNGAIAKRLAIKSRLSKAIEHGELTLHYQAQAEAAHGRLTGFEALLRWQNPDFGSVSPDQFIPLAEETGLIVPIGEWVLRSACGFARDLIADGVSFERVSVNLSARQFYQQTLVQTVARALADTGLAPERLELEITESVMMKDTERVLRILHELKEMKVKLAVDDFGTGYSSLGYLQRFPLDRLKIDRSFIDDVPTSRHDSAIAKTIITLGHNLDLSVMAEGVETHAQLAFLCENGCDEFQGYLLSKPLDSAAVREFIRSLAAQPSTPHLRFPISR